MPLLQAFSGLGNVLYPHMGHISSVGELAPLGQSLTDERLGLVKLAWLPYPAGDNSERQFYTVPSKNKFQLPTEQHDIS